MILYVNVYDILGCFVIYRYCNSFYRIFMFWIFVIFYNDYVFGLNFKRML